MVSRVVLEALAVAALIVNEGMDAFQSFGKYARLIREPLREFHACKFLFFASLHHKARAWDEQRSALISTPELLSQQCVKLRVVVELLEVLVESNAIPVYDRWA